MSQRDPGPDRSSTRSDEQSVEGDATEPRADAADATDPRGIDPDGSVSDTLDPERVDPDSVDADVVNPHAVDADVSPDAAPDADAFGDDTITGESADHDIIPIGTHRRRIRMYFGLLLLAVILGFLIWFIASNADQNEHGSFFGHMAPDPATTVAIASSVR